MIAGHLDLLEGVGLISEKAPLCLTLVCLIRLNFWVLRLALLFDPTESILLFDLRLHLMLKKQFCPKALLICDSGEVV